MHDSVPRGRIGAGGQIASRRHHRRDRPITTPRFTWDSAEAAGNLRRHRVAFELATRVFLDPFAPAEQDRIEALAAMPDDEIDTSDIPPLTDAFFANAVRNPVYRPLEQQLTVRLDADVLAWLEAVGRGDQTRIDAILRETMLTQTQTASAK